MRIAILGATSHIAKGLILGFHGSEKNELFLFARSPERVQLFLESIGAADSHLIKVKPLIEFTNNDYEVVINCVGIGNPAKLANELSSIFKITELFDNIVLEYLKGHCKTLYINFSSGTAYGTDFSAPVDVTSQARFNINAITASEYYGIAKINSEAKHRAMKDYNIVDLRVFGYFSRFIDLNEKFLLSEIVTCIQKGKEFVTGPENIVRDFVTTQDLLMLIEVCMAQNGINDVLDVYSAKPATKFEILDHFAMHHGLKYRVDAAYAAFTVTGSKDYYNSTNDKAAAIGYIPKFSSIDGIENEVNYLLKS
jgi:nucleoside-diphosphate-sugar epimerase